MICSAGSCPMPRFSTPATPPIRSAPSSTATCRSASPLPRRICCSSRSNSTASTTTQLDAAMARPALGHYRPWLEDIRKEKPYQLDDQIEQLFHEKSVTGAIRPGTGCSTRPSPACASRSAASRWRSSRRSICCRTPTAKKRKAAAEALAKTFKDNLRPFTLITNTLAKDKEISDRWRSFKDVADCAPSRQPGRARSRRGAGRGRARGLSAAVASLLRAEGALVRQEALAALGPQRAAAESRRSARFAWDEARATVLDAYGAFSPRMADIAERFFDKDWIDAPVRPGKAPGAFAHPTVPSAHPYVLLNYHGQAARRDDARA